MEPPEPKGKKGRPSKADLRQMEKISKERPMTSRQLANKFPKQEKRFEKKNPLYAEHLNSEPVVEEIKSEHVSYTAQHTSDSRQLTRAQKSCRARPRKENGQFLSTQEIQEMRGLTEPELNNHEQGGQDDEFENMAGFDGDGDVQNGNELPNLFNALDQNNGQLGNNNQQAIEDLHGLLENQHLPEANAEPVHPVGEEAVLMDLEPNAGTGDQGIHIPPIHDEPTNTEVENDEVLLRNVSALPSTEPDNSTIARSMSVENLHHIATGLVRDDVMLGDNDVDIASRTPAPANDVPKALSETNIEQVQQGDDASIPIEMDNLLPEGVKAQSSMRPMSIDAAQDQDQMDYDYVAQPPSPLVAMNGQSQETSVTTPHKIEEKPDVTDSTENGHLLPANTVTESTKKIDDAPIKCTNSLYVDTDGSHLSTSKVESIKSTTESVRVDIQQETEVSKIAAADMSGPQNESLSIRSEKRSEAQLSGEMEMNTQRDDVVVASSMTQNASSTTLYNDAKKRDSILLSLLQSSDTESEVRSPQIFLNEAVVQAGDETTEGNAVFSAEPELKLMSLHQSCNNEKQFFNLNTSESNATVITAVNTDAERDGAKLKDAALKITQSVADVLNQTATSGESSIGEVENQAVKEVPTEHDVKAEQISDVLVRTSVIVHTPVVADQNAPISSASSPLTTDKLNRTSQNKSEQLQVFITPVVDPKMDIGQNDVVMASESVETIELGNEEKAGHNSAVHQRCNKTKDTPHESIFGSLDMKCDSNVQQGVIKPTITSTKESSSQKSSRKKINQHNQSKRTDEQRKRKIANEQKAYTTVYSGQQNNDFAFLLACAQHPNFEKMMDMQQERASMECTPSAFKRIKQTPSIAAQPDAMGLLSNLARNGHRAKQAKMPPQSINSNTHLSAMEKMVRKLPREEETSILGSFDCGGKRVPPKKVEPAKPYSKPKQNTNSTDRSKGRNTTFQTDYTQSNLSVFSVESLLKPTNSTTSALRQLSIPTHGNHVHSPGSVGSSSQSSSTSSSSPVQNNSPPPKAVEVPLVVFQEFPPPNIMLEPRAFQYLFPQMVQPQLLLPQMNPPTAPRIIPQNAGINRNAPPRNNDQRYEEIMRARRAPRRGPNAPPNDYEVCIQKIDEIKDINVDFLNQKMQEISVLFHR